MKELTRKDIHKAYKILTDAIMHCRFGSQPIDREPTEADLQAAKLLASKRYLLVHEFSEAFK